MVVGSTGIFVPSAFSVYSGALNADQVLEKAKAAASSVKSSYGAIVTEAGRRV
jgi:hypothetical protein